MRPLLTALSFLLAFLAGTARADKQQPAKQPRGAVPAEVLIVLASNAPGGIDPRLANVAALRAAPFNNYRSMALLRSPRYALRIGQAQQIDLPNGRRVRIVLREVTGEGRFRLTVSINRPGEEDYLPELNVVASPGDPFFVAGQSFQQGTLVIGFRLGRG